MHINFLGQIVPFIYVLMSNRKESTYCAVFQYINENIFVLECKLMMSDYERAMRNGFNTVVPSTKQYGCLFHYMSALKRFVKKNPRLLKLVLKDLNAHTFYRRLMCLPLLPTDSAERNQLDRFLKLSQHKHEHSTTHLFLYWIMSSGNG